MSRIVQSTRNYLGTPIQIMVGVSDSDGVRAANDAIADAFDEADRIEATYSRFDESSELMQLNARLGEWVELMPELFELIAYGVRLHERTKGAFDLTVQSILEGWGYDADYSLTEREESGQLGQIQLDEAQLRVRLEQPIDLGGLGKGYALDLMADCLADFENVMINAGGDLWCSGTHPLGIPWTIHFEHPTDPTQAMGTLSYEGEPMAFACSNPNRRQWRDRHHLVDPKTQAPARDMLAVYTQSSSALAADATATALFAIGFSAAQKAVTQLEVEAMLVAPNGEIWRSPQFLGDLFRE